LQAVGASKKENETFLNWKRRGRRPQKQPRISGQWMAVNPESEVWKEEKENRNWFKIKLFFRRPSFKKKLQMQAFKEN